MMVNISIFYYKGYFSEFEMDLDKDFKNILLEDFSKFLKKICKDDPELGDVRTITISPFFDDIEEIKVDFI